MKKQNISTIILIILTVIVSYFLLKDNFYEIIDIIVHANMFWIIIALALFTLYLYLQTIPFFDLTKIYYKKISFSYMFYIIVATNFFNGITPLATGGQPLQVYELHKKGIPTVDASNAVLQNSIIFQIAIVLWSILSIIINNTLHLFPITKTLKYFLTIGVSLNIIVLFIFIFISFSKNFNRTIINFIIKVLHKLHIVKDMEKQKEKWNNICKQFYENSSILIKNKWVLIKGVLLLLLAFSVYYTIPFTIAHAINCSENLTIMNTIILSSYVLLSSNYLPIPGATGGVEYSFIGYFKNFVKDYKINALLICWRFITYYLPTIIGGVVFSINSSEKKEGI